MIASSKRKININIAKVGQIRKKNNTEEPKDDYLRKKKKGKQEKKEKKEEKKTELTILIISNLTLFRRGEWLEDIHTREALSL